MNEVPGKRGFSWHLPVLVIGMMLLIAVLVIVFGEPCLPCAFKGW